MFTHYSCPVYYLRLPSGVSVYSGYTKYRVWRELLPKERDFPKSTSSYMDLDSLSVHKHAKKELGLYLAILTEQARSITHI